MSGQEAVAQAHDPYLGFGTRKEERRSLDRLVVAGTGSGCDDEDRIDVSGSREGKQRSTAPDLDVVRVRAEADDPEWTGR
jgi:hypothetical protein